MNLEFNILIKIGAITDKSYHFKTRSWELRVINTVDIFDGIGSNISVYLDDIEIKRILPLKNDLINEEWISNKTRYFFEGLVKWRINIPLMKKRNMMIYVSWTQAFFFFCLNLWFYSYFCNCEHLIFLNNLFINYEAIVTSKILIKKLGFLSFDKKSNINVNDYYLYYINNKFFEQIKDKNFFFFIGHNLRLESPILTIKLRKRCFKEDLFIYTIGSNFNDNLNMILLGLNINTFIKYLQGKLNICNKIQKNLKKYLVNNYLCMFNLNIFLIGNSVINRIDNHKIYKIIGQLQKNNIIGYTYNFSKNYLNNFFFDFCNKNFGIYLMQKYINIQNNLSILYLNLTSILYEEFNLYNNIHNISLISKNDILYLFGIDLLKSYKSNFLVFQGHHINSTYLNIDLILPSFTFLEKSSEFLNIEGHILHTNLVLNSPIYCRADWSILNALYMYILTFVNKIYSFNLKKLKNYLNTNIFYMQINNKKKLNFFLKKSSINIYFNQISILKAYGLNNMLQFFNFKLIKKMYNSIFYNVSFNIFDFINQDVMKSSWNKKYNYIFIFQKVGI